MIPRRNGINERALPRRCSTCAVNPPQEPPHKTKQKHNKEAERRTRSRILTAGLMELTKQGAWVVGSGAGIPGPISSLESIHGPGGLLSRSEESV